MTEARVGSTDPILDEFPGPPAGWVVKTPTDATRFLCALALGVSAEPIAEHLPTMDFQSPSADLDRVYVSVPTEHRATARGVVTEAFRWYHRHFATVTPPGSDGTSRRAIEHIDVRHTSGGGFLSASSADRPGHILLGAPWPLACVYQLASLIAHETIHQGLFVREAVGSPVRPGSLAYSPWRRRSRPGRLVWHAYWTFACQFLLLADVVGQGPVAAREDASLLGFAAAIPPRVDACFDSLKQFRVVTSTELDRCHEALNHVRAAAEELAMLPQFATHLQVERETADGDYQSWVDTLLSRRHEPA